MRIAICYYSHHHGNTRRVVQAMAQEGGADLIDITAQPAVSLAEYDCVGLASGIYGFEVHPSAAAFARRNLPQGKPVFLVYTYGGAKGTGVKALETAAEEKGCPVLGIFGCKGYDTFGPFRLVGGIAKGRPNADDLQDARRFFRQVLQRLG